MEAVPVTETAYVRRRRTLLQRTERARQEKGGILSLDTYPAATVDRRFSRGEEAADRRTGRVLEIDSKAQFVVQAIAEATRRIS